MKNLLPRCLRAGSLAYIDSLYGGLVPCKVLRVWRSDEYPHMRADVVVTAKRYGWNKGEKVEWPAKDVPPRDAVRTRSGQFRIMPFTCVEG